MASTRMSRRLRRGVPMHETERMALPPTDEVMKRSYSIVVAADPPHWRCHKKEILPSSRSGLRPLPRAWSRASVLAEET
jgi:hypothetical protein